MKTKVIIIITGAIIFGLIAFWSDVERGREAAKIKPVFAVPVANSVGFACAYAVGAAGALWSILFALPWLWRGFLKCIREFSKAIRGKE